RVLALLRRRGNYRRGGFRGSLDGSSSGCRGGRRALLAYFEAQVGGDNSGGVVVEGLVDGGNGAVGEQRFDDLGDRQAEECREIGNAHDRGQLDHASLGGARSGCSGGLGGAPLARFE